MKVEIDGLAKEYDRGIVGLHDTSLTMTDGVFALLGPNGAGKSTLMSILATLLEPTRGTARIDGFDVRRRKDEIRQILGYLPQDFGLYPSLSVYETLDYVGMLYNMPPAERRSRIDEVMQRVNLTEVRDRAVSALSGGMHQRVGLAQALLNRPKLLIVDEPTAGLDPEERIRVRSLLAELGGERVIILSTHLIEDVQAVADRVAVLYRGRVRFDGTIPDMMAQVSGKAWEVELPPEDLAALRGKYLETALFRVGGRVRVRLVADAVDHADACPANPTMEDAYLWLMREGNNGRA